MLLTLSTRSLNQRLQSTGGDALDIFDLPAFTSDHLLLRGLNIQASLLSGWGHGQLDKLRDRADKAACPCLVLVEDTPLPLLDPDEMQREGCKDRIRRLAAAAHRLGCNALALKCMGPDTDDAVDQFVNEMRTVMPSIERLELNVLLSPHEGLTNSPDRLTELIKRIGGFRIGSLPSFGHAAETGDAVGTLRKLAPYAGAIHATARKFNRKKNHVGFKLEECVGTIRNVGFVNTLAIDYVGDDDPIKSIELARQTLQAAIDAE